MPSVDKAILNPFEPLSITEALLVAVCGLVVVFMMLAMLMVVIYVISWVVQQIDSKRKPTPVPAKKTAPAPAPKPAPAAAPAQTLCRKAGSEVRAAGGHRNQRFHSIKTKKGGVTTYAQKENCSSR